MFSLCLRGRIIEQVLENARPAQLCTHLVKQQINRKALHSACLCCCHRAFTAVRLIKSLIKHFTSRAYVMLSGTQLGRLASRLIPRVARSLHTERKVKVQGSGDLHIVECGNGSHSLLLMPGALGSAWTDFKPQIEQLPKLLPDHTIIAWDPPGYGKSIPPQRKFGLEFYREDAEAALKLMRALNRPKFSILGWSDGGITALILAGRHADAVDKLAIWGAGAYLIEAEVKALQAIRDVATWSPRMREPMEKVYGVERFAQLWAEWVDAACDFYAQRDGDFCRTEVQQVQAPTFILHGKKDPMIAAEHVPWLRERLPQARYHEFPEGKHNIHLRYAEEFNKLVSDFFRNK